MNRKSSKYREAQKQRLDREKRIGDEDYRGGLNIRCRTTHKSEKKAEQEEDEKIVRSEHKNIIDKKTGEMIWIFRWEKGTIK